MIHSSCVDQTMGYLGKDAIRVVGPGVVTYHTYLRRSPLPVSSCGIAFIVAVSRRTNPVAELVVAVEFEIR
jgi:hypothetical protein